MLKFFIVFLRLNWVHEANLVKECSEMQLTVLFKQTGLHEHILDVQEASATDTSRFKDPPGAEVVADQNCCSACS